MNTESDSQKNKTKQAHNRFRDGIIWGIVASLSIFFLNPFLVVPITLLFAAVAGYRGKSLRPAFGTIVTVSLVAGIGFMVLYFSISGINN